MFHIASCAYVGGMLFLFISSIFFHDNFEVLKAAGIEHS
jgi:hypothetical protein